MLRGRSARPRPIDPEPFRQVEPVILNVKGSAYEIKTTVTLLTAPDADSGQELFSKVPAQYDFGSMQVRSMVTRVLLSGTDSIPSSNLS